MTTPDYSTTRRLTSEKPACFDTPVDGMQTLLKTPDSEHKIAEGGLRLQGLYKTSSEDKPLITVVTVVYNGAEFLEDTIKSVIEQTYDNVEYIIVDGGSTDGTLEIIKKYEHAIDYWVSEPDKGIYDAMNKGIDLGSGEWINFMNAGDTFFYQTTLQSVVELYPKSVLAFYGDFCIVRDNGIEIVNAYNMSKISLIFLGSRVCCHQSVFYASCFIKNHKFNLDYRLKSDLDSYFNLIKAGGEILKIDIPVARYSLVGVSASSHKESLGEDDNILKVHAGLYYYFYKIFQFARRLRLLLVSRKVSK